MLGWICSIGVEKVIKPRELLVSSNLALEKTRDLETRRKTDVFLLEIFVLFLGKFSIVRRGFLYYPKSVFIQSSFPVHKLKLFEFSFQDQSYP